MRNKIAKFIAESVKWLIKEQLGCCRYQLDEHLAIFVGWSAGYGDEKRDDVIQAKNSLDWGINVGVKVWTSDYLQTDYDFLNFPYRAEDGEVWDMGMSIAPNDDYEHITDTLLEWYDEVKHLKLANDGKILGIEFNSELSDRLKQHEWSVDYDNEGSMYFSKYSPAGHDFGFDVRGNTLEELAENIYDYYEGYDVSYEASLWLDNTGHGCNGAPYDMKDLYEDMEACEKNILELYELIKGEI